MEHNEHLDENYPRKIPKVKTELGLGLLKKNVEDRYI